MSDQRWPVDNSHADKMSVRYGYGRDNASDAPADAPKEKPLSERKTTWADHEIAMLKGERLADEADDDNEVLLPVPHEWVGGPPGARREGGD